MIDPRTVVISGKTHRKMMMHCVEHGRKVGVFADEAIAEKLERERKK